MPFFRNEIKLVFYITAGVCSVLVAVMAVRMDVGDSRNDRMRSLCALYWGAPDGSTEESRALVQAERSTGISNLEMLSYCRFYGDQKVHSMIDGNFFMGAFFSNVEGKSIS